MSDPWKVLGVPRSASKSQIRDAYRQLALRWHPDRNGGCEIAAARFRETTAAYELIKSGAVISDKARGFRQWRNAAASRATATNSQRRYTRPQTGFQYSAAGHERRARAAAPGLFRILFRNTSPPIRIGLGIVTAATLVGLTALITDFAWKSSNRGKSLDEILEASAHAPRPKHKSPAVRPPRQNDDTEESS